ALAGPPCLGAPPRIPPAGGHRPDRRSGGVPRHVRAGRGRLREPADPRRRPDARRCRCPPALLPRPLLPHGDRLRPLPAPDPVCRAGRSRGRPRRVQARSPDGVPAGRRARAGSGEGLDPDCEEQMSELLSEERIEELEIPAELPVLPLKETVVFPQSMTPLAIGQERSVKLVELTEAGARLREISAILNRELEVVELGSKIQSQVQSEMEKGQREYFLRQQLKAIQEELGEGDAEQAELNELREQLAELELPEDV